MSPRAEHEPFGTDFQKLGPRTVLAIPRSTLPNAPRGTVIVAAELEGGVTKTWRVDGYDVAVEPDLMRLILLRVTDQ